MICLWVAWVVSTPALSGEVQLRLEHGHVKGRLHTVVAEPARLVAYPAALDEPYEGDDVDRLWDYPGAPSGTNFIMRVNGKPAEVGTSWSGEVTVEFDYDVPERYGALGRLRDDVWLTAPVPFFIRHERALPVDWRVDAEGTWPGLPSYRGAPEHFFVASATHGFQALSRGVARFRAEKRQFGKHADYTPQPEPFEFLEFSARNAMVDANEWVRGVIERTQARPLPWLVVPLRRQIAECAGGVVLVSREAFRATPFEDVYKFHRLGLARTALSCAFENSFALDSESADALAVFVLERQGREVAEGSRDPKELLKYFRFVPDIDSLLYAPQMPWAATYFSAIDETERGPPTPSKFYHTRPNGKLFFEKLRDRLGDEEVDALFGAALTRNVSPIAWALEKTPEPAVAILEDFFHAYPRYDMSFTVDGASVVVQRRGPGASVREPNTVEIEDADGTMLKATSNTEVVSFPDAALPIQSVQLDPDRRQVELDLPPGAHPRFDNSDHHGIRLVLTRLVAGLGFSATEVSAGIDFSLRREWDLKHHLGFGASYDPSSIGGSLRYSYAFGPRVTADALAMSVGIGTAFERLTQGFVGEKKPYLMLSGSSSFVYDDRPAQRTAMQGQAALAYVGFGMPFERELFGYGGVGAMKFFRTRYDQALALRVRFDAVVGSAPGQALFSLGGRSQARGYALGELTVRNRMLVSAEYRHEIVRGFRANFADLVWIDGIEGAVFADLAVANDRIDRFFDQHSLYGDVGYGIRILYDQLGVNPGVLTIDFGIPLRRVRTDLPPVAVFIGFVQSFSDF